MLLPAGSAFASGFPSRMAAVANESDAWSEGFFASRAGLSAGLCVRKALKRSLRRSSKHLLGRFAKPRGVGAVVCRARAIREAACRRAKHRCRRCALHTTRREESGAIFA